MPAFHITPGLPPMTAWSIDQARKTYSIPHWSSGYFDVECGPRADLLIRQLGIRAAGERFYLRNLRLDHKTGVAFLNLKYEPGHGDASIRYQTEIKLDPLVFRPFFDEKGRKFIDAWNFGEVSTIYIAAVGQGEGWNPMAWSNRGEIEVDERGQTSEAGIYAASRISPDENVEYVVAINNAAAARSAEIPTYTANATFATIHGGAGQVTSNADGELTVTVEPATTPTEITDVQVSPSRLTPR